MSASPWARDNEIDPATLSDGSKSVNSTVLTLPAILSICGVDVVFMADKPSGRKFIVVDVKLRDVVEGLVTSEETTHSPIERQTIRCVYLRSFLLC